MHCVGKNLFYHFLLLRYCQGLSAKGGSPRLWLGDELSAPGKFVELSPNQLQHMTVLRVKEGDEIQVFGKRMGEYSGKLEMTGRRSGHLIIDLNVRRSPVRTGVPSIELCFAPLRKKRASLLIEKATELGATALRPIATQYTQAAALASLGKHPHPAAIQAAEQCERLDIPTLAPVSPLADYLRDANTTVFACIERQENNAPHLLAALIKKKHCLQSEGGAVLVGPEGGFSDSELALIRDHAAIPNPSIVAVSLGSSVLRAETAAISALSILTAVLSSSNDR